MDDLLIIGLLVAAIGIATWLYFSHDEKKTKVSGPYANANPAWIKHVRETLPISWIPITEKAPAEGEVCITYHEHTGVDIMRCCYLKGEDTQFGIVMFVSKSGFLTDDVTHWIPLAKRIQEVLTSAKYV